MEKRDREGVHGAESVRGEWLVLSRTLLHGCMRGLSCVVVCARVRPVMYVSQHGLNRVIACVVTNALVRGFTCQLTLVVIRPGGSVTIRI